MRTNTTERAGTGAFPEDKRIQSATEWCREKIKEKTSKVNRIPFFYKACLKFMISKLGTLSYLNSEDSLVDITCVHANPERTIAKLKQETNIILPIISINQDTSDNDDKRRRYHEMITSTSWWSKKKKRAYRVVGFVPTAVNIDYKINVWTKYKADMDQIVEQVRSLFNTDLVVINELTTSAKAFLTQESDQSTVETSDRQDRILRRSFTIKIEGYIPQPQFLITSTGEIEEFNIDSTLF